MNTDLERRVAAELRAELARQGRSRHWLADETGIPVTTVARWLRGPWFPGLNELDAIARALDMTVMDLLQAADQQRPALLRAAGDGVTQRARRDSDPQPSDPKVDAGFHRFGAPRRDRRRRRDWQRTATPLHLQLIHSEDAA